jgi:membrane protein implicated in regulation of membrane protease activity
MRGSNWLAVIVISLGVGFVVGVVAGFFGLEMPWWSWAIVGVAVVVISSAWEAYRRRKKTPGQTEVEEGTSKSEE